MSTPSELRESFCLFKDDVYGLQRILSEQLDAHLPPHKLPGYLGEGRHAYVFSVPNNPDVVVKFHHNETDADVSPTENAEARVEALLRGIGHSMLEQIVSYGDLTQQLPPVLCGAVEGRWLEDIDERSRNGMIPHFPNVLRTFKDMQGRGLKTENTTSNVPFSSRNGFRQIDYLAGEEQTLEQKVVGFAAYDMLLSGIKVGRQVPDFGLAYRDAVATELGSDVVQAVEESWRYTGYRL